MMRITTKIAALVARPGARAKKPLTVNSAARPTAGSSHDQRRWPSSASSARPTSSEAAQTSTAEMYVPSMGRQTMAYGHEVP